VSIVTLLCEDGCVEDLRRLAEDQGYRPSVARSLTEVCDEAMHAPDLAILVADSRGVTLVHEMDMRGLRYWLLAIGAVPPSLASRLPRKPHARVPSADGSDRLYLERLLDDWRDRQLPRVDCFHFSYREGVPPSADWVLDVRFLESPYWVPRLRGLESDSREIAQFVTEQPAAARLLRQFTSMLIDMLPDFVQQRRTVIRIGVGCTGGEHRSQAMTDALVASINATGCATAERLNAPPVFLVHESASAPSLSVIDLVGERSDAVDLAYREEGSR
jgi:P-loop ATPase protein family